MMTISRVAGARAVAAAGSWRAIQQSVRFSSTLAREGSTTTPQPPGGKASLEDVAVKPGIGTFETTKPYPSLDGAPNKFSATITSRRPSDATGQQSQEEILTMLEQLSWTDVGLDKGLDMPQIGISSVWPKSVLISSVG